MTENQTVEIRVRTGLTPNQIVARNMKRLREDHGWSKKRLAERFNQRGYPNWTATMVWDAENADRPDPPDDLPDSTGPRERRKPRRFTVDDLVALSRVLKVSVMDLLTPEAGEVIHAGSTINAATQFDIQDAALNAFLVIYGSFRIASALPFSRSESPYIWWRA